jgi:hypothetical protein
LSQGKLLLLLWKRHTQQLLMEAVDECSLMKAAADESFPNPAGVSAVDAACRTSRVSHTATRLMPCSWL